MTNVTILFVIERTMYLKEFSCCYIMYLCHKLYFSWCSVNVKQQITILSPFLNFSIALTTTDAFFFVLPRLLSVKKEISHFIMR